MRGKVTSSYTTPGYQTYITSFEKFEGSCSAVVSAPD